jgi:hypothetical protein
MHPPLPCIASPRRRLLVTKPGAGFIGGNIHVSATHHVHRHGPGAHSSARDSHRDGDGELYRQSGGHAREHRHRARDHDSGDHHSEPRTEPRCPSGRAAAPVCVSSCRTRSSSRTGDGACVTANCSGDSDTASAAAARPLHELHRRGLHHAMQRRPLELGLRQKCLFRTRWRGTLTCGRATRVRCGLQDRQGAFSKLGVGGPQSRDAPSNYISYP